MTALEVYAARSGLTMYRISKISGLPPSTIKNAFKKTLGQTTIRTLQAIAKTVQASPGELLDELLEIEETIVRQELNDINELIKQQLIVLGYTIVD
ncbi:helix-turn-helix domain-containing protein [Vagococcus sp. BWB3-3]|uniref:Helix-turn-helix domain-containing protein n=1 Tax=Vagococcus allomyrinae TaxID=2794353 RepID=A0A940SUQ3_9ENTE|nr:helix-turn-helix domain-containing protein [Vagococcus allomyrinae]MBP1044577.1 helix-turn-helix domain-containing protein [Vagococcus allomyrinae]